VVRLGALHPGAPLCCNLLEHVTEPDRLAYHYLDLGVWRTCVRYRSHQLSLSSRPDRHDVSVKPFRA
jgi:hypothetical protein